MKTPWLIQRCELTNEEGLIYDYMGSAWFERGNQGKALKRMFSTVLCQGTATISINNQQVIVYMIASEGFSFSNYQQHLQADAEGKLHLEERTGFGDAVKEVLGIEMSWRSYADTNVWFDFENDVLWALTENDARHLVSVLERIKAKWAEKK